jgi:hypothetical protein
MGSDVADDEVWRTLADVRSVKCLAENSSNSAFRAGDYAKPPAIRTALTD